MTPGVPLWRAAPLPACPPFPGGTVRADVAVIGAGFAGLSTACHLLRRRPGARVLVLEAARLGHGASGRTTGMLGPGVGQSLPALVRRLGKDRARALYQATQQAVQDVVALVREENIACELALSGQLLCARTPAARGQLQRQAALLAELALPVEVLGDEALGRRLRLLGPPAGEGPAALFFAGAGTLHPVRLLAGLAHAVVRRGGVIYEGARVLELRGRRAGQPAHLRLATGVVLADEVVIATAGYTQGLGVLRGRILPVHLQVLHTEPLGRAAQAAIGWAGREGVRDARRIFNYYRLSADDRIVFGGGAPRYRWGGDLREGPDAEAALVGLRAELLATFPAAAELRVAGGWTGVIGYVIDALPAIQRLRGADGVVHAVGWCGHGVALATAAGAWVTRLLCEGLGGDDLPWFRDDPPLVPTEPLRWLGFQATIGMMGLLDRLT